MDFSCLSAAGIRFLGFPTPAAGFCRSYVGLTGSSPDHIGVPTFRSYKMRPGWVPSLHRDHGVRFTSPPLEVNTCRYTRLYLPLIHVTVFVSQYSVIGNNGASSKVHLRSPVRSFPCLWFASWLGSPLGFCLSLSTPPLPAAQREVGTGVGHSPESKPTRLLLLVSERLRVALGVTPSSRRSKYVSIAAKAESIAAIPRRA